MLTYYGGNVPGGTPGIFNQVQSYYWWMAGAAWNAVIQYWWLTGDAQFNQLITQAMLFQVGDNDDYMPANQTHSEGNDDQCFWGLAAIAAAEMNFPNPPSNQPQWLALAQAVFNEQMGRWDPQNCGGGLRWQIFPFNSGYDYKNSISNGCLFHLGARLARYTGNWTYVDYCDQIYTWMNDIGIPVSPQLLT
jgi:mannan endo-1,6-alpha-mannosidase